MVGPLAKFTNATRAVLVQINRPLVIPRKTTELILLVTFLTFAMAVTVDPGNTLLIAEKTPVDYDRRVVLLTLTTTIGNYGETAFNGRVNSINKGKKVKTNTVPT